MHLKKKKFRSEVDLFQDLIGHLCSPPSQSHHGLLHSAPDSPVYLLHLQSAPTTAFCHLHRRRRRHPCLLIKEINQ